MSRRVLWTVAGFLAVMAMLIALAPKSLHRRVSASIVPASVCSGFGGVRAATLTSSVAGTAATRVYSVTCSDGAQTDWSNP